MSISFTREVDTSSSQCVDYRSTCEVDIIRHCTFGCLSKWVTPEVELYKNHTWPALRIHTRHYQFASTCEMVVLCFGPSVWSDALEVDPPTLHSIAILSVCTWHGSCMSRLQLVVEMMPYSCYMHLFMREPVTYSHILYRSSIWRRMCIQYDHWFFSVSGLEWGFARIYIYICTHIACNPYKQLF